MMNETIELSAWVWVPLLVLTWVWGVGMMGGGVGGGGGSGNPAFYLCNLWLRFRSGVKPTGTSARPGSVDKPQWNQLIQPGT